GIGQLLPAHEQPDPTPTSGRPQLTQHEKSREKREGKEVVTYVLKAERLPVETRYQLGGRWMNGRTAEISRGVRVDESGRVLGPGGDEVERAPTERQPGEFMMVALVSEDRASTAAVLITPFPIQSEGKGGCRLSVETLTPKGEAFLIRGSGFRPAEDIA